MEGRRLQLCILCLAVSTVFLRIVYSQATSERRNIRDCTKLTAAELEGDGTNMGLIPQTYVGQDGTDAPEVRLLDFNVVCEAPGVRKNMISSVSVIVSYTCLAGPICGPTSNNRTEQFQFDCNTGAATRNFFPPAVFIGGERSVDTLGDLSTPIDLQCGQCAAPNMFVDGNNVTHCVACEEGCVEGQMRCIGSTGANSLLRCCNWYLNDICHVTCPDPLVGDPETFDCGCGELTLDNGDTGYTDAFRPESVATHTCDTGYKLMGGDAEQTCSLENGWSGTLPFCSRIDCGRMDLVMPMFGSLNFDSTTFGSVVTYSCQAGYVLEGDETRVCEEDGQWSGDNPSCVLEATSPLPGTGAPEGSQSACGTGCIIGIVLAVLGAIILAAVLAGVAYAIYSYKNNPDTKLSKYDADNINGVARDNPLYVDPDAVVGAGDGAEAA